jgi:kynurenine formamidase
MPRARLRSLVPALAAAVGASAALAAGACSSDTPIVSAVPLVNQVLPPPPFPQGWRTVDLTRPLDDTAPHVRHPRQFPFERIEFPPAERTAPRTGAITTMEHMGTHVAAPRTREPLGATVERLPAADLMVPLAVVDPPAGAATQFGMTVDALRDWERENGAIPPGAAVVLRTGSAGGDGSHAGWTGPAIRWLAAEREARFVGTDAPTLDPSGATRAPAQAVAAGVGAWGLVSLTALESVPRRGAFAVVGVLPVVGAAGAPARVVALVPPDALADAPPRPAPVTAPAAEPR